MVLVYSPEPSIDVEPVPCLQIGPPRRLRRVTATLPIVAARLPEAGLRIVHLSDLHLRRTVPRGLVRLGEELRRELAMRYLEEPSFSVSEIGCLLGYAGPSAFTAAFRRWTGTTPRDWRRDRSKA